MKLLNERIHPDYVADLRDLLEGYRNAANAYKDHVESLTGLLPSEADFQAEVVDPVLVAICELLRPDLVSTSEHDTERRAYTWGNETFKGRVNLLQEIEFYAMDEFLNNQPALTQAHDDRGQVYNVLIVAQLEPVDMKICPVCDREYMERDEAKCLGCAMDEEDPC